MPKKAAILPRDEFLTVVRDTPLVSVDLVVRDPDGRVLVGLRTNEPAKGTWFVPGGRICKDERVADAFARITHDELGVELSAHDATFLGVFEHQYGTNFAEEPEVTTHYIVLGYEIRLDAPPASLPEDQHSTYRWMTPDEIATIPEVHANTTAYFRDGPDQATFQTTVAR